jgi:hypothetical protein
LITTYSWHVGYWIGLRAVPRFPNFIWADPTVASLGSADTNWGLTEAGLTEPVETSLCGGARRDRPNPSYPSNYGWASLPCSDRMPFVCRLFSELPADTVLKPVLML